MKKLNSKNKQNKKKTNKTFDVKGGHGIFKRWITSFVIVNWLYNLMLFGSMHWHEKKN